MDYRNYIMNNNNNIKSVIKIVFEIFYDNKCILYLFMYSHNARSKSILLYDYIKYIHLNSYRSIFHFVKSFTLPTSE